LIGGPENEFGRIGSLIGYQEGALCRAERQIDNEVAESIYLNQIRQELVGGTDRLKLSGAIG
jgi:hypothetical protein